MPIDHIGQLHETLARSADTHRGLLSPPVRRGVRAGILGLLRPDAARVAEQERLLVTRVRTRRREPRLVAFIAGKGGVGTTTTAAGVALTLAALRSDTTCIVDVQAGTWSLGERLAGRPAPSMQQLADRTRGERVGGLLSVVDGAPWHSPPGRDQLMAELEGLRTGNTATVVDLGNDVSETATAVLDRADQLVVVTTTSQDSVASTWLAFQRIRQLRPDRLGTVVAAVTCLSERRYRKAARRLRTALGVTGRIVAVPFDPALAAGGRLVPSQLRSPTREAFLRLAGLAVEPGPPHPIDDRALAPTPAVVPQRLEVWPR